MSKTILDKVRLANAMAEGIRKNLNQVSLMGLNETFCKELSVEAKQCRACDERKEAKRKELVELTRETNIEYKRISERIKIAKKIVKLNFPQEKWASFGVPDIR